MVNKKPAETGFSAEDATPARRIRTRSTARMIEVDEQSPEFNSAGELTNDLSSPLSTLSVVTPRKTDVARKGRGRSVVKKESDDAPSTSGSRRGQKVIEFNSTPMKRRKSVKRNGSQKKNKRSENSEDEEGDSDEETFNTYGTKLKQQYKDTLVKRSCDFLTQKKLIFARDSDRVANGDFSAKQKSNVNQYIAKLQGNEDTIFLTMPVTLATKYPDDGDYRHSTDYLEKQTLTMASLPKNPKGRDAGKAIPKDPRRLQLTGSLYLSYDCKSKEVIDAGAQFLISGVNAICEPHKLILDKPSKKLFEEEKKAFAKYRKDLKSDQMCKMPCPIFDPKNARELYSLEFEKLANAAPVTLINNLGKTLGINLKLFTIEIIVGLAPDADIDILDQIPMSADYNYTPKGARSWKTTSFTDTMSMADFLAYVQAQKESAFEAYQIVADSDGDFEAKLKRKLAREMKNHEVPEGEDPSFPWIKFGTNVDMLKSIYGKQFKEVMDKFPKFLRPKSKDNLLDYCGCVVLGVNTVQIYLKVPGVRTPAHMENSLMASVNWNAGPGTSIWMCVPYEYWGVVNELCIENHQKFNAQDYWPSENALKERNIPYYKFEQKKDQCVYLNTGTLHWVQSNGFCLQAAWNVGQPTFTQLATAMVSYDFNLKYVYQQWVPLVSMAWNFARKGMFVRDERMYKLIRSIMIRSLGYNKMYFDLIGHHKLECEKEDCPDDEQVYRCDSCKCEIFNIIRWYKSDRDDVDSYPFCSDCTVRDEWKTDRTLSYTYFFTLDELCAIFDNYIPNRSTRRRSSSRSRM